MGLETPFRGVARQLLWEGASPDLQKKLSELAGTKTWAELAAMWGYSDASAVRDYVRGPLRRRMEREGVAELLRMCVCD